MPCDSDKIQSQNADLDLFEKVVKTLGATTRVRDGNLWFWHKAISGHFRDGTTTLTVRARWWWYLGPLEKVLKTAGASTWVSDGNLLFWHEALSGQFRAGTITLTSHGTDLRLFARTLKAIGASTRALPWWQRL